jgi:hypothetical protein
LIGWDTPRQSFGFALVGNASQNERVIAGSGTFHRIPLILFTDGIHQARFSVDRHPIDNPHHGVASFFHDVSSRSVFLTQIDRSDVIPQSVTVQFLTSEENCEQKLITVRAILAGGQQVKKVGVYCRVLGMVKPKVFGSFGNMMIDIPGGQVR